MPYVLAVVKVNTFSLILFVMCWQLYIKREQNELDVLYIDMWPKIVKQVSVTANTFNNQRIHLSFTMNTMMKTVFK